MAGKLSKQHAAPGSLPPMTSGQIPNAEQQSAAIQRAFKEIYEKSQDIAAAEAEHVTPLKEDRTKRWRQLKTDTGLTRKGLERSYKLYALDRDIEDFDDDDEREKALESLRAGFQAIQEGKMLSFLTVVDGSAGKSDRASPKDATSKAKEAIRIKEARTLGRQAGEAGKPAGKNPYPADDEEVHTAWEAGRTESQDALAKTIGTGKAAGNA